MSQGYIFDGETYEPAKDGPRLGTLLERVWSLMSDGEWRNLEDISKATGGTEASVSARLRDFRKPRNSWRFRVNEVQRKRVTGGLWVYRFVMRPATENAER